uniref:Uncharacterized protein n=1 Tax=Xenopus tropicalis TaxID=8364 RepID=A0A6I8STB2_XENTR
MPRSNAGHFAQTLMLDPNGVHNYITSHPFAFGDTNDINHLILAEDRVYRDLFLQLLMGPVHLVSYSATIQLDLHNMSFLLTQGQEFHLHGADVFLHCREVFFQLFLALFILPFLAVLFSIETPLALIADVLCKYGFQTPQSTRCLHISHYSHHYYGQGLLCCHDWSLTESCSMDLSKRMGHPSLVTQKSREMDWFTGVILGPGLDFPSVAPATLMRQEPKVAMPGS